MVVIKKIIKKYMKNDTTYIIIAAIIIIVIISVVSLSGKNKTNVILPYVDFTKYALILGLSSIFTILNSKIDILMIEFFLSEIEVSIYGIGSQLAFLMYLPTVAFSHILMSKLSIFIKE